MTSCFGYQILLAESDRRITATSVKYVHPHLKKNFKCWFKTHVELHPWLNHIITPREKKSLFPIFQQKYKQLLLLQGYMISEFHFSYTQWHRYYFILNWCQGNIVTVFTQAFTRQLPLVVSFPIWTFGQPNFTCKNGHAMWNSSLYNFRKASMAQQQSCSKAAATT